MEVQSSKILEDSREFHTKYCKKSKNIHKLILQYPHPTNPLHIFHLTNKLYNKTHPQQIKKLQEKNIKLKSKE